MNNRIDNNNNIPATDAELIAQIWEDKRDKISRCQARGGSLSAY